MSVSVHFLEINACNDNDNPTSIVVAFLSGMHIVAALNEPTLYALCKEQYRQITFNIVIASYMLTFSK